MNATYVRRDKVALVTGAARGIGRAIALTLARSGADVVVNDLPGPPHQELADQTADDIRRLNRRALVLLADVSDRPRMEDLFAQVIDTFGHLDIAVANAAANMKQLLVDMEWSTARRIIDVTLCGVFHVCQLAARQMIRQYEKGRIGGKILITSSVHTQMAIPFHAVYAMSKAAVNQLCRSLAAELLPYRINVNAVNPGWIDTPGERHFLTDQQLQEIAPQLPWGRLGTADEIAELFGYLASDAADYMTGSIVTIDGGSVLSQRLITTGLE